MKVSRYRYGVLTPPFIIYASQRLPKADDGCFTWSIIASNDQNDIPIVLVDLPDEIDWGTILPKLTLQTLLANTWIIGNPSPVFIIDEQTGDSILERCKAFLEGNKEGE